MDDSSGLQAAQFGTCTLVLQINAFRIHAEFVLDILIEAFPEKRRHLGGRICCTSQ